MTTPSGTPDSSRHGDPVDDRESGRPLIFCGMCGALNPTGTFYCAACGTTLVDAFHATEGLRVYERPDSASRLIEIVPSGTELDVVEDPSLSEDFVRVRLISGRLGYIRLQEVDALALTGQVGTATPAPDINTNARGCVTPLAALGALALVLMLGVLMLVIMVRSDTYDQGTMMLLFCVGLGPLLLLTVAIYLYARSRDDRLNAEEEDARTNEADNVTDGENIIT
ncbi:MAG: SH3 domain-containing protein [Chloroflexota bacterium]|nr:SH3 domain-containing protein [Chloroflexota bacterium]